MKKDSTCQVSYKDLKEKLNSKCVNELENEYPYKDDDVNVNRARDYLNRISDDGEVAPQKHFKGSDKISTEKWVAKRNPMFGESEDYKMKHRAPYNDESNSPLHDLSGVYGEDIYGPKSHYYYGTGDDMMDKGTTTVIKNFKGKPDSNVTIYRALPKHANEINAGDWVTINKQYALQHGETHMPGNFHIISKKVPAKHVFSDGNSIHEFGYDPREPHEIKEETIDLLKQMNVDSKGSDMDFKNLKGVCGKKKKCIIKDTGKADWARSGIRYYGMFAEPPVAASDGSMGGSGDGGSGGGAAGGSSGA